MNVNRWQPFYTSRCTLIIQCGVSQCWRLHPWFFEHTMESWYNAYTLEFAHSCSFLSMFKTVARKKSRERNFFPVWVDIFWINGCRGKFPGQPYINSLRANKITMDFFVNLLRLNVLNLRSFGGVAGTLCAPWDGKKKVKCWFIKIVIEEFESGTKLETIVWPAGWFCFILSWS